MKLLSAMCPVVAGMTWATIAIKTLASLSSTLFAVLFVVSVLLVMNVNNEVVTLGANNRDRRYRRSTVDTDMDDKGVVFRRLYCHSLPFSSCRGVPADYECRRLTKITDKRAGRSDDTS